LPTSPEGTIRAEEVWKRFKAEQRIPKLREEIQRLVHRGNGRAAGDGWLWALSEVGFKIEPGDSVGLVGANGSGKSTLLKILTQLMYPTAGKVHTTGRIGALIELRAGIHPELTGRENVYLTGSLMGLPRRRVAERFDDIVAFSELEEAIDRQVKYYSSGMWMRLGFGVAAFLEPDILLVDEVLAVGDAAFQQRCLDRMRYVMSQGTTLVFVSHDLAAVEATCTRGLWLHSGDVMADGPIREVLSSYRQSVEAGAESRLQVQGKLGLRKVEVRAKDGGMVRTQEPLDVSFTLESDTPYRAWIYLGVSEGTATPIFVLNPGRETSIEVGETTVSCSIARLPLPRGRFFVWAAAYREWTDGSELLGWQPIAQFDVYGPELDAAPRAVVRLAPIQVEASWEIDRS